MCVAGRGGGKLSTGGLIRAALLTLATFLGPPPAAALHARTTPEERCARAGLVLTGEVTGQETRWAAGPEGGLETTAWIAVDRVYKGVLPRDPEVGPGTLALVLPGGELGGEGLWLPGTPRLAEDARYLFLLEPDPERGWQAVGGEAGAVRLQGPDAPEAPTLTAVLREHGGCRG